ncbi:hypothetical protein Mgra_00009130, partial [Meloidogyne graminicola]
FISTEVFRKRVKLKIRETTGIKINFPFWRKKIKKQTY